MHNALLAKGNYGSEELTMFQETTRRFMQTEVAPNVLKWDEDGQVDRAL